MRLLLLIAGAWAVSSLLLGLLVDRIIRSLGRRYPAPRDAETRSAEKNP